MADRRAAPVTPGDGWLARWRYRSSTVLRIEEPSDGYRLIVLGGESLRGVAWAPGQKMQIAVGGGSNRTYTPLGWDSTHGETAILAYLHSDGPGSQWAARVKAGDECRSSGPRRSLELDGLGEHPFLFGDETSMGLALALPAPPEPNGSVAYVFEVSSAAASRSAWQSFRGGEAAFVQRRDADAHLEEVESRTLGLLDSRPPTGFVLSGKVTSIQRLQRLLKSRGIPTSRLRVKAYWAPGKKGLD